MIKSVSRNTSTKKLCKAKKGIGILRKLYHFIPRTALLTIYKTFIHTTIKLATPLSLTRLNQFNTMLHCQLRGNKKNVEVKLITN